MRVLHIISRLGAGGAEQQLRLLLRHLPARCDVLTLTAPGAAGHGIRADGVPVTHLPMGVRDPMGTARLARFIRGGGYDLVHTHLYRACVHGRIAARLAGVGAVVATEHSLGERHIDGRPLTVGTRARYLATERLGSATVAVSAAVADRLRGWGVANHRIHLVPNGLDARHFSFTPAARTAARARLGIPPHAFVVGGVGRLVAAKRFDVALRAVAELPQARLLLVGDGPERTALHDLAAWLGVADRIRLLGERDGAVAGTGDRPADIPGLLAAMDVFVAPSAEEAFGLAALEAVAAGLPVLHGVCPALDELPPGAAPGARRIGPGTAALADALRERAAAGPVRHPVPAAVERYDIVRTARRLALLYERSVSCGPDGCARGPAVTLRWPRSGAPAG
ncbi:putative glycosyl transferase [Streptomyces bingchenggensis BCW-1]|uniref:D-inositol 3-phosphate glycosyltransferase n=1 Tax=Streptomyces bingchenggensis (strain BCW-1) TaxID=749414 RepID=D7BSL7_STRBB|nr:MULTISPECIES: glycosyltransferase [Streptomyces]ADI11514.1 putative glycosyl transferase [Streptomyces bingchenggensis BCW-1]